jgi:hypothetical protein
MSDDPAPVVWSNTGADSGTEHVAPLRRLIVDLTRKT